MSNITRRVARLSLVWAAVAVAGLVAAPSANAAASFSSSVPTKATGVTTGKSENTGHGTLQIRKGKYDGKTYLWGRISSPDSTLNAGWDLKFMVTSSSMPGSPTNCLGTDTGSTKKDIDTTTYTSAVVLKSGCRYEAAAVQQHRRLLHRPLLALIDACHGGKPIHSGLERWSIDRVSAVRSTGHGNRASW